jgi:hypothetical protein
MDTNKEANAIVLRSSGVLITDNEDLIQRKPAIVVDMHKNIFDEAYAEIFGGNADPNQPSVADTKTTIAGSDAKLGETPTMDSGKYKLNTDGGDPFAFLNVSPKQDSTTATATAKKAQKKSYKHVLLIVVLIVFAIIFLKGLLK